MFRRVFFLVFVVMGSGCLSAPVRTENTSSAMEGHRLEYELVQQGDVKVFGLYLVGTGGTYDYALQYESPGDAVAMLFVIRDEQSKMVRRVTVPSGKGVLNFNANSDWVEGSESLKLEVSLKGSSKKTIMKFEGR